LTDISFASGRILDNYATTAIPVTDAVARTLTVPANRRWWVFNGIVVNGDSVTRTINVIAYNSLGQEIINLLPDLSITAGATYPIRSGQASTSNPGAMNIVLKAGDYVVFTWAASGAPGAGGTGKSTLLVIEVDV